MKSHMTNAAVTAIKMLETLPEDVQEYVVDKMREYVEELRDEAKWQKLFAKHKASLEKMARKVKEDIDAGKVEPMDFDKL